MRSFELDLFPTIGIGDITTLYPSIFRIIVLGGDILVLRRSILFHLVVRSGRSNSTHVEASSTKAEQLHPGDLGVALESFGPKISISIQLWVIIGSMQ